MSVPELVRERLQDEPVEGRVSLGDEDALLVTPTRTLIYHGEGLIREATVDAYPHDAEGIYLEEGRRKSTIHLDHGLDGESEFTVPTRHLESVLPVVLGGVLRVNDVLGSDEAVEEVYRLGELTMVLAERRLLKHVGDGLWDRDAEVFDFEDVTALDVEKGEVSSQIIVELDGRPERIKVPTDDARGIRERIEESLFAHHGVENYVEFERLQREARVEASEAEPDSGGSDAETSESELDDGIEFGYVTDSRSDDAGGLGGGSPGRTDSAESDLAAEVAELREVVERQTELLEAHERTIERLIDELKGR